MRHQTKLEIPYVKLSYYTLKYCKNFMKTLQTTFSVLFLFFISLCYSQNYKFDKIVKHNLSPYSEQTTFFNSEDDS